MDETCRLRRGEGYGVCADVVVNKCALTGESYWFILPFRRSPSVYGKDIHPTQTRLQPVPLAALFPAQRPPE